jgi:galactonate dehydratase
VQPDHANLDSERDGIARVQAVRQVMGHERNLMVDGHWRFNEATARKLITQLAQFNVYWVECSIAASHGNAAVMMRLCGHANALGAKLAGLELAIGLDDFMPNVQVGNYDMVMPDVKYFAGLQAIQQAAVFFYRYKVEVLPHNPTGPVCHAASLQVAAAMGSLDMLELHV